MALTDDDLARIEAANDDSYAGPDKDDIAALVAEVRRLRALVEPAPSWTFTAIDKTGAERPMTASEIEVFTREHNAGPTTLPPAPAVDTGTGRPDVNVYVWGLEFEEHEDGDLGEAARAECRAAFGTDEDCLVIDVAGRVLLNTTDVQIDRVWAS